MKYLLKHLILIAITTLVLLVLVFMWLRAYTHHGEKLTLPDYIDKPLSQSRQDAHERDFEIVVTDSVFIVGKAGGIIQDQNPKPGSQVKRNRKIYAVVSKNNADLLKVADLPRLYGEKYSIKERELLKAYEIKSETVDYVYDSGLPDMIMEVRYKGKTIVDNQGRKDDFEIPKGGTLQFVLSKKSGGYFPIPNLVCLSYEEAKFLLDNNLLTLGERSTDGSVTDLAQSYVSSQTPSYIEGGDIKQGDTIHVVLTGVIPPQCQ